MSCGVGCRHGSGPALLWLWRRLVATAPIGPLAREPPYAVEAALEKAKRQKQKQTKKKNPKTPVLSKAMCRFSVSPIKIPMTMALSQR